MTKKANSVSVITFFIFLLFSGAVESKTINTFIARNGGDSLRSGDEVRLAKHDIIFCNKFHYDDIRGDTWDAIKDINPKSEIFLYGNVAIVNRNTGNVNTLYLNELGRYSVSRGHSMGSLNGNNPNLFLLDSNGNRIRNTWNNDPVYWLDFGNSNFQKYAVEAISTDYANRPWTTDGVFSDEVYSNRFHMDVWSAKYNTNEKWATAMKSMILAMSAGLHAKGQKFAANSGLTYNEIGANSWIDMDQSSNHPDVLLEESAFAVKYGTGDIQFYPEAVWLAQLNLLNSLQNIKGCYMSSCDILPGQTGIDNWGKSFNFWDAFYYAIGSYLLGKNDIDNTAFFNFQDPSMNRNSTNQYYDEYDRIDLGVSSSDYRIRSFSGNNIYWREYAKGYVYVNPTGYNVSSISLPESCKNITHSNINTNPGNLPNVNSINLPAHRAAILYKSNISNISNNPQPPPNTGSEIIVDNGNAGTSSTGSWQNSGGPDYYGSVSLYSRQVGATYTYQASVNGSYEVSLWWTLAASRDQSVPVRIYDGNTIIDTVWVDQTEDGGQWNSLGTYNFNGTARIVIESETTSYSACADAVMFKPMNTEDIFIIDNGNAGTSSTGSWQNSGGPDYYGSVSLYSRQVGATYTYQASVNGSYEVSLWWTLAASRDQSVPVRIYDGNTIIDTVWVNQTKDGGQWNTLGTYNFNGTARIVIESETTSYSACADAVMLSQ